MQCLAFWLCVRKCVFWLTYVEEGLSPAFDHTECHIVGSVCSHQKMRVHLSLLYQITLTSSRNTRQHFQSTAKAAYWLWHFKVFYQVAQIKAILMLLHLLLTGELVGKSHCQHLDGNVSWLSLLVSKALGEGVFLFYFFNLQYSLNNSHYTKLTMHCESVLTCTA